jgi:hypothetical protein
MSIINRFLSVILVAASALTAACNTFEPLDGPSTTEEIYEQGRFEADAGDCVTARDRLYALLPYNDDTLYSLGFAQLCIGGALLEDIGSTVATYTSTAGSDYTVVGYYARRLLPWSQSKQNEISAAVMSFQAIREPNRRAYSTLVGHLSKLAIIVAKSAGTKGTLVRDDISTAANCPSLVSCSAGGMSDGDAIEFRSTVSQMATDLGSLNLQGLRELATALNSTFGGLSNDATRFTVRNNVVPAN